MRVAIEASCLLNRRGYGRFLRSLLAALARLPRRHELVLYLDAPTARAVRVPEGFEVVVVPLEAAPAAAATASSRRSLRDLLTMSAALSRARADLVFFPSVYTYTPVLGDARVLVGIHDVIAERYPDLVFPRLPARALWLAKGLLARRQADHVLTVSGHARRGLVEELHVAPERISVVGEAPDPVFAPDPPAAATGAAPYVVVLGGLNPHKNVPALVRALATLPEARLVVIGEGARDSFTPGAAAVDAEIVRLGLGSRVTFTGYLEDEAVATVLRGARTLALPSFDEGFGLPAVEAAACGVPVIATTSSPLPELLEGGGLFVDPRREEDLADALRRLFADDGLHARLAATALLRARALTWEASARAFLSLLDRLEGAR